MMAGCLLAALSYYPIYKGMAAAAGNNVVSLASKTDPVTGAISARAPDDRRQRRTRRRGRGHEPEHARCWCCWSSSRWSS